MNPERSSLEPHEQGWEGFSSPDFATGEVEGVNQNIEPDDSFTPTPEQIKAANEQSADLFEVYYTKQAAIESIRSRIQEITHDPSLTQEEKDQKLAYHYGRLHTNEADLQQALAVIRARQQMQQFD